MDLSTKYLGFQLPHPFIVGSCGLADRIDTVRWLEDSGAPMITLRSLFEEQIVAEELAYHGAADAAEPSAEAASYFPTAGTFTFGPDEYLNQIRQVKAAVSVPVVASLNGTRLFRCVNYAHQIQEAGADALELNYYTLPTDPFQSAKNVEDQCITMVKAIKGAIGIPVALKISPFFTSLPHFVKQLEGAGLDGLVIFNRFYQPDIDIEKLELDRVLHLSTSAELLERLRWTAILFGHTEMSLGLTGGVHTPADAIKAVMAGANAVQLVSALYRQGPAYIRTIRDDVSAWLEAHEYESLEQARGSMSLRRVADTSGYERANYAEILRSWKGYAR